MNPQVLLERVGIDLLSFCLCSPADSLSRWADGGAELRPEAQAAARRCAELLADVPPGANNVIERLCEGRRDGKLSCAVQLHLSAGGALAVAPEGDGAAAALAPFATEAFALLLMAQPVWAEQEAVLDRVRGIAAGVDPNVVVQRDPRLPATPFMEGRMLRLMGASAVAGEAQAALAADPAIAEMFEAGRRDPVPTVIWASSLGHAQTVQLPMFVQMLLVEGYRRVRALGRAMTLDSYFNEVLAALDAARQASRTGSIDVPAIVALRGGVLEAHDSAIETPWGILRPLTERHAELGPASVAGMGRIVLETSVSLRVAFGADLDAAKIPVDEIPPWLALRGQAARVGEAALLASGGPLVATWLVVLDPFATSLRPVPEAYAFGPSLADRPLSDDLALWSQRVAGPADHGVAVARSRVVSAVLRPAAEDALIDAVVAWEALFGDTGGELRFRIAASIAWLLGPSPAERQALFKLGRDIYDYRSKIVHGARSRPHHQVLEHAAEATDTALRALRALYLRGGDILTDPQARTRDLFLNA